jgi:hypothetical protein
MLASGARPPGPRGLPIFGNSYMARRNPMGTLKRWALEYGDIVSPRICQLNHWPRQRLNLHAVFYKAGVISI